MTVELRAPFAPAAEPPPAAASRSPRLPQPPMWLVVVAGVVLVVTLVAAFLAALRTGIPIDEPYHVTRLRTYMATGHFAMPGVSGADLLRDRFTYAPVTMLALHALCWVLGIDGFGTVSTTATAYAVRHVGVFLMGVVGLGAVAGTARILLRSWRWGVVAAALLAAMPTWMGHLAFNIKDIPVATGASLVTFGLVWLAAVQWRERSSWPAPVAAGVVLTSGLVLALGTRVGMWPLLAAQVVAYAALLSLARRMRVSGVLGLVVPGVVAYAVLVLVYPYVFAHPLLAMRGSVSAATEFRPDPPSRTYVPEYLIVEVPTLMLLAAGVGSLVAIVAVVARLRRPEESTVAYAVVGLQALLMPALSVAEDASLYSGLRQLLFVFPGLAILAAVGLAWLLGRCRPGGWARPALAGLLAASALLATVDEVRLFPFQYAYRTPVADATALGDDSTDYWRLSFRELAAHVPADAPVACYEDAGMLRRASPGACAGRELSQVSPFWKAAGRPLPTKRPDRLVYLLARVTVPVPDSCSPIAEVTRMRHGTRVVMSRAYACHPAP